MKARRIIIGSLLLLLLLGTFTVWRQGGNFDALASAYTGGGDANGGGLRRLATSLWMTMVNAELGIPPGSSADGLAPAGGDQDGEPESTEKNASATSDESERGLFSDLFARFSGGSSGSSGREPGAARVFDRYGQPLAEGAPLPADGLFDQYGRPLMEGGASGPGRLYDQYGKPLAVGAPLPAGGIFDQYGNALSVGPAGDDSSPAAAQAALPGGGAEGLDSAGASPGNTEIAQAAGDAGTGNLAMGKPGAAQGPAPRSADFEARLREREALLGRYGQTLQNVDFPLSVQETNALSFDAFLRRSQAQHMNWYSSRAEFVGAYDQAQAQDRAAINQSFLAAQAKDRQASTQANLLAFMASSRNFNNRRAEQNNRFQSLLDRTGTRVSRRFQLLFQQSLARHIAAQSLKNPDQEEWRRLKAEALANVGSTYGDGRVPAASQPVNRGVRNYMQYWIAFFYDKKIQAAEKPKQRTEPVVVKQPEVVEKFRPQENCGPTDLHTYSLDRMRKFVKSLESRCRAANGLPDLLLKECHPYHIAIDLKVSCKRDLYYFIKFDSENTYDRTQAIDHFNDGCRPYRSVQDLGGTLASDPNRGIDSLQKDRLNRMLEKMRGCRGGGTLRPTNSKTGEPPSKPALTPTKIPAKEPEAIPEPEPSSDLPGADPADTDMPDELPAP